MEEQRKKAPKGQQKDTELAPVLPNSLGWGSFMALSANSRYQIINGIEERVLVRVHLLRSNSNRSQLLAAS